MTAANHRTGRAWLVSGLAIACSAALAWVTPIHDHMEFWLRGPALLAYEGVLFVALFLGGVWVTGRSHGRPGFLGLLSRGTLLGYLAGLCAVLLHPLLLCEGVRLFLDSLPPAAPEAVIALLWFPVRLLSWLPGAFTGLFIGIFLRIIPSGRTRWSAHDRSS